MQKNQFPKVKNSLLELEKDFMDLKDKELKNRKEKKLKEGQKNYFTTWLLFLKMVWVSLNNKNWKKLGQLKKWYDWLIKETIEREERNQKLETIIMDRIIRDIRALF